ncbi:hypothetical protein QP575_16580 [Alcaligenes faecalis subsp. phenolicus]|uniref:hypothetical protein n=1 Tax=Alcaligenes nematophilus TaxID=2994643 RepID=UPI002AA3D040|nr:hypothetical protein [Alcaligenes phenolicus]
MTASSLDSVALTATAAEWALMSGQVEEGKPLGPDRCCSASTPPGATVGAASQDGEDGTTCPVVAGRT